MKGASWQQVGIAIVVWLLVLMSSIVVATLVSVITPSPINWPPVFPLNAGLIVTISVAVPLLGAGVTALNVRQVAQDDTLDLLRLTDIRPSSIVWGSFVSGLYNLRFVIAVIFSVCTAPFMLGWVRSFVVFFEVQSLSLALGLAIFATLLTLALFVVTWVGPLVFSVALGVGLGLRLRGDWLSVGPLLAVIGLLTALFLSVVASASGLLLFAFPQLCLATVPGYFVFAALTLVFAENWVFLDQPVRNSA